MTCSAFPHPFPDVVPVFGGWAVDIWTRLPHPPVRVATPCTPLLCPLPLTVAGTYPHGSPPPPGRAPFWDADALRAPPRFAGAATPTPPRTGRVPWLKQYHPDASACTATPRHGHFRCADVNCGCSPAPAFPSFYRIHWFLPNTLVQRTCTAHLRDHLPAPTACHCRSLYC